MFRVLQKGDNSSLAAILAVFIFMPFLNSLNILDIWHNKNILLFILSAIFVFLILLFLLSLYKKYVNNQNEKFVLKNLEKDEKIVLKPISSLFPSFIILLGIVIAVFYFILPLMIYTEPSFK